MGWRVGQVEGDGEGGCCSVGRVYWERVWGLEGGWMVLEVLVGEGQRALRALL